MPCNCTAGRLPRRWPGAARLPRRQGRTHAELLARYFPSVTHLHAYDTTAGRATEFRTGATERDLPFTVLPEQAVFVDDVDLVRDNPRRILGDLMARGRVVPPGDTSGTVALSGTLGEVLTGTVAATRPGDGTVVSNPFGMAVLDVGLLSEVAYQAADADLGTPLDLLGA